MTREEIRAAARDVAEFGFAVMATERLARAVARCYGQARVVPCPGGWRVETHPIALVREDA